MVDLHSHIIFDVDDGSSNIEESLKILQQATKVGFTDVFLTPHYLEGVYEADKEELNYKFSLIKQELLKCNNNINIYLGNEIYVVPNISGKIISNKVNTLNNTRYVLIEIPLNTTIIYLDNELDILLENGYIPVLAHPERYIVVQKNKKFIEHIVEKGVLLQSNYGSLIGKYGKEAEKTLKYLLKNKYITFMGADVHSTKNVYLNMQEVLHTLNNLVDKDYFENLIGGNAIKYKII